MGLFARFVCLHWKDTAEDLAQIVRKLLQARNVVETAEPDAVERLLIIAPAGDGWLMVVDHVEDTSSAVQDDSLLAELSHTPGTMALDIFVADSDDLILLLIKDGEPVSQLHIRHDGLKEGVLEPWRRLLLPGRSTDDIPKAFAKHETFVEAHLAALKGIFGIDLTAFDDIGNVLSGRSLRTGTVLLRLKSVRATGQIVGPPKLEVDEIQRQNFIRNRAFPQIPRGLVTHFPAFCFKSRGAGARGLEVRLTGSALNQALIEMVSGKLLQSHPVDRKLNREINVAPESTEAGTVLHFGELEVPDWVEGRVIQRRRSLDDLLVFVYCRGLKIGDAELEAEAKLVAPMSPPIQTSYPVTVLPDMWRPLKSSDQPPMTHAIHAIRMLNQPVRINALAVLRGEADQSVSALRRALDTWRSLIGSAHKFDVAAATEEALSDNLRRILETSRSLGRPAHMPTATERANEAFFFSPADSMIPFKLDVSKKRQGKWDQLMTDLPSVHGLRITSEIGHGLPREEYSRHHAERIVLHYTSPAKHPRLPEYAARLGHLSLSGAATPATELALVSLMRALAADGLVCQAYVATWDNDDEPRQTLYERAADIHMHLRVARGWSARYLRAVADRLWLGPEFAAMLPDRVALDALLPSAKSALRWRSNGDPRRRCVTLNSVLSRCWHHKPIHKRSRAGSSWGVNNHSEAGSEPVLPRDHQTRVNETTFAQEASRRPTCPTWSKTQEGRPKCPTLRICPLRITVGLHARRSCAYRPAKNRTTTMSSRTRIKLVHCIWR
jgi:hypothetical protein